MERNLTLNCGDHKDEYSCPDVLIDYSEKFDEYGLIIHDGGTSSVEISYCPFCGAKLPESKRGCGLIHYSIWALMNQQNRIFLKSLNPMLGIETYNKALKCVPHLRCSTGHKRPWHVSLCHNLLCRLA